MREFGENEPVIICLRTADGPALIPSTTNTCSECGEDVHIGLDATPLFDEHPEVTILCMVCASEALAQEMKNDSFVMGMAASPKDEFPGVTSRLIAEWMIREWGDA